MLIAELPALFQSRPRRRMSAVGTLPTSRNAGEAGDVAEWPGADLRKRLRLLSARCSKRVPEGSQSELRRAAPNTRMPTGASSLRFQRKEQDPSTTDPERGRRGVLSGPGRRLRRSTGLIEAFNRWRSRRITEQNRQWIDGFPFGLARKAKAKALSRMGWQPKLFASQETEVSLPRILFDPVKLALIFKLKPESQPSGDGKLGHLIALPIKQQDLPRNGLDRILRSHNVSHAQVRREGSASKL
jgi:hypothetical protein